jgi:ABC-type dipeptide/oligopeptide/nickel transport system permease component
VNTRSLDYIIKRIGFSLMTVFVVLTFNFVLFRALPGSAVADLSRVPNSTPALRLALARQFGLADSKWQQYLIYLKQLLHGNLGVSYINGLPVWHNLSTDLSNTIPMVGLGTLLAIVFGIWSGVTAAWRWHRPADYLLTNTSIAFYSFPTQWLGLMLVMLFGRYLPTTGMNDPFAVGGTVWSHALDTFKHMILPAVTVALTLYGQFTLVVRSAVLEVLGEDFVLTARAKGIPARTILRRYVLRNALLPIVTLIALSIGYVVGGALLVETVFTWPGIGLAVYQSVLSRDYPMLQGAFLILTLSVVMLNLVADLLSLKLDPRVAE